ncbi:MAG: carboxylating nicotinate-nucleotide diphosphorylase [Chloroflexota bacterium]|nr:carboxylating nicotinate-nucleotide diphosphorylase [Chloroflexota bacterium]
MSIEPSATSLIASLDHLIELALDEDMRAGVDVTRPALPPALRYRARIVAKSDGVIAGLMSVERVYAQIDTEIIVTTHSDDGDRVTTGTLICQIEGAGRALLSGERTALNFLQHLSGVATLTRRYVDAIAGTNTAILDTRKTTPGYRLLEKDAVRMGGGQNHRMGLYDAAMIKDNHIDAAGSIALAVERVRASAPAVPIIVEVRDLDELRQTLPLNVNQILLDNMTLDEMRACVVETAGRTPLEASGNMTLERVRAVAETGVNYISVGALTHSAPALDLSMQIERL